MYLKNTALISTLRKMQRKLQENYSIFIILHFRPILTILLK